MCILSHFKVFVFTYVVFLFFFIFKNSINDIVLYMPRASFHTLFKI